MYYTVIKHDGHLRTRGKCKKHEPQFIYNKHNSKFQRSTGHQSEKNRKDEQVPAKTINTGHQSEGNRKDYNKISVCKKMRHSSDDEDSDKQRKNFDRTRIQQ